MYFHPMHEYEIYKYCSPKEFYFVEIQLTFISSIKFEFFKEQDDKKKQTSKQMRTTSIGNMYFSID